MFLWQYGATGETMYKLEWVQVPGIDRNLLDLVDRRAAQIHNEWEQRFDLREDWFQTYRWAGQAGKNFGNPEKLLSGNDSEVPDSGDRYWRAQCLNLQLRTPEAAPVFASLFSGAQEDFRYLSAYACILATQGDNRKVVELLSDSINIYALIEKNSAEGFVRARLHRLVASAYSRLGKSNDACKNYSLAIDYLRNALKRQDHAVAELALSWSLFGSHHRRAQKLVEAENCFSEAQKLFASLMADQPERYILPNTGSMLRLAELAANTGKPEVAALQFVKAIETYRHLCSDLWSHRQQFAALLMASASFYRNTQQLGSAENLLREAAHLVAAPNLEGNSSKKQFAEISNLLGYVLADQSRLDEAEVHHAAAFDVYKECAANDPDSRLGLAITGNVLADLCRRQGKIELAETYEHPRDH
jgi:tetratricopeptide (TPR) repeat protein